MMSGNFRSRPESEARRPADSGAVLVYVAILIPVLFAAAAIAVDITRWYVEVQRVQKTVDAAALAAAPYMPDPLSATSAATVVARDLVTRNGFVGADARVLATDESGSALRPTQVRVELDSIVSNGFGGLLGVPATTITRSAVGEFTGPAPLGSPCNVHGNEPLAAGESSRLPSDTPDNCSSFPQFWPTIYGPEIYKTQGDQFATRKCGISPYRESNCATGSRGAVSDDFDPKGYAITIKVREKTSAPLTIQLYDPAYVDTEALCQALPTITDDTPGSNTYVTDAVQRYAPNATAPLSGGRPSFCAGDGDNSSLRFPLNSSGGGSTSFDTEVPTITSFGMLSPTDTLNPFDSKVNTDNRLTQCTQQFPGFRKNGGGEGVWSSDPGVDLGTGTTATQQLSENNDLTEVFHRWVTLCTIPSNLTAGDYYLRVRTNVPLGDPAGVFGFDDDDTVLGNGGNRFSIRAFTGSDSDADKVSVSPYARMPIFANTNNATTDFNLIRVAPESAGANIIFTFFDVGDATTTTGGSGTLTVLPPEEAKVGSTNFDVATDCTKEGSLSGNAPVTYPDAVGAGTVNCFVDNIRNDLGFNGQQWKIVIPVPAGYDCNNSPTDPFGCWWRLRVKFTNTSSVTDQTTWTANLDGDPVRLVK